MKLSMIILAACLGGCASKNSMLESQLHNAEDAQKRMSKEIDHLESEVSARTTCERVLTKVGDLETTVKEGSINLAHTVETAAVNAYNAAKPVVVEKTTSAYDSTVDWAKKEIDAHIK